MVLPSGCYSLPDKSIHTFQDSSEPDLLEITTSAPSKPVKFRRDKDSWPSVDDGHMAPRIISVCESMEPNCIIASGSSSREKFGLIPTDESGAYSNKFIGVSGVKVEDELDNHTVWVVSSKWKSRG
ncbi:hypothetical protein K439DRAFT_1619820 [Ramaria rubella]|nr:hypothetical protein K439DRAFT_1619820 [Ramaria rubella]